MAMSFLCWSKAADLDPDAVVVVPVQLDDNAVPPSPGFKRRPPSIAQLAMPSPDDSPSGSSSASHEPLTTPALVKDDVPAPRLPNRLRKAPPSPAPPPSSYPFSFVPEDPSPVANFPYSFRSALAGPVPSFVSDPGRSLSAPQIASRKLAKRRPPLPHRPVAAAVSDLPTLPHEKEPPAPIQRRNTFSFNFRRKMSFRKSTQSDDCQISLPTPASLGPLALDVVCFPSSCPSLTR
ncbi:hypothetical protein GGX14DRAFT_478584 [Mycena pura]|uniref:Uncharacterized protein n=1 Tax=Mycena pura TaxID=153505 RepID=A0AAD6UV86_9AGAR|nr:hypothetical protein GGX14DRAFT_478584 [Mycena pura]